jgi:hypothetical protein
MRSLVCLILPKHCQPTVSLRHQCHRQNLLRNLWWTCKLRRLCLCWFLFTDTVNRFSFTIVYAIVRAFLDTINVRAAIRDAIVFSDTIVKVRVALSDAFLLSPLRHRQSQSRLQRFLCLSLPKHSQRTLRLRHQCHRLKPSETQSVVLQAPSTVPSLVPS